MHNGHSYVHLDLDPHFIISDPEQYCVIQVYNLQCPLTTGYLLDTISILLDSTVYMPIIVLK